ncbi:MAG TPA: TetR/AcrR family transcriptional regulator [Rhizomicrobium sp.]|jgi:AcrR family transcriptional regulator|nr:TetR/AcrR family transcriptional regulator [Rhizomicrobium sp.]
MSGNVALFPSVSDRPAGGGRRKAESLGRLKAAARRLFVERGYDATRPQDIAREAGLGHGTFYLHYPDKRACFMAFVEDARQELNVHLQAGQKPGQTLEARIAATLNAIYDYSDRHPGVLRAATTDMLVIDAEGGEGPPLLMQWGREWADMIRFAAGSGMACSSYDADIIGQAIVGALHQTSREAHRSGRDRSLLVENLTRFLTRALRPA